VQGVFASPGAIAFELGPLQIRWYGILMATAILVGFWLAHRRALQEGLPADQLVRAAQWAVVAGLVGARLYEVAFNWDYYGRFPWKIIAVWEGGLAMHGGLIVGPLVGALLARRCGVPVLAWKLYISPPHRPPEFRQFDFFHPTFLYESLWNLLVFAVLVGWVRPRLGRYPGAVFFAYIGLYSAGRFFIEALRLDSFWVLGFRVAQVAGLVGVIVAVVGLAWVTRRGAVRPSPSRSS